MKRWGIIVAFPVLALTGMTLTGCGPNSSTSCDAAFKKMEAQVISMSAQSATAYTDDQWNAIELGPLDACKDFGDWLDGAKDHPRAVGFTDSSAVHIDLLVTRCHDSAAASTVVCEDMKHLGLL